MERDYVTARELGAEAGVTTQRVYQEIARGRLQGEKVGMDVIVPKQAAEAWLAERSERRSRVHGR